MRLLYIHNGIFPQPVANRVQVVRMCEAFAANGEDVTLLAFREEVKTDEKDIFSFYGVRRRFRIRLLNPRSNYYRRSFHLFLTARRMAGFDAVYTRDLLVARLLAGKTKVIYELHDYPRNPLWRWLFRRTLPLLHRLVAINQGIRNDLMADGYEAARIVVLPDGVDLRRFDNKITREAARKRLHLPPDKRIAVYAGTFTGWKGVETLCEASRLLDRDWLIILVGAVTAEEFALPKRYSHVRVTDRQMPEIVAHYYKAADVLVLPNTGKEIISARYTSPLKLFEYMAAKRPIVASDLPSIRSIVSEQEVTFFRPDDPADLARAIGSIGGEEGRGKKNVKNAFIIAERHTWERRAESIIRLLKSALPR